MIHELDIEYPRIAERRCWECDNCKTLWYSVGLVETWRCSAPDCESFTCEHVGCRKKCFSCDRDFCDQHLTSHDYGDKEGLRNYCATCVADAAENLPRCTSCGANRSDLEERETADDGTGYRANDSCCKRCLRERWLAFFAEMAAPETADADVAF